MVEKKARLLAGFLALAVATATMLAAPPVGAASAAPVGSAESIGAYIAGSITASQPVDAQVDTRGEHKGKYGANSPLCLKLKSALMRITDIPNWLAKKKIQETRCSTPGKKSDRPLACFEDGGADVWGATPRARAYTAIKLGGEEKKGAALESGNTLYKYKTRAGAGKAWKKFVAKLKACPADATIQRGDKKEKITIRQQQKLSTVSKYRGRVGYAQTRTLRVKGSGISKFTADISNYVVYRLVGTVIIRAYLNKSTQAAANTTLGSRQKGWVRTEAKRVGSRIAKIKGLR